MFVGRMAVRRAHMLEAFTAGWQAALAVNITNPRVLEVIESCFDLWLEEASDDREIMGFHFQGRRDLPKPSGRKPAWVVAAEELLSRPSEWHTPENEHRPLSTRPWVPPQRTKAESPDEVGTAAGAEQNS